MGDPITLALLATAAVGAVSSSRAAAGQADAAQEQAQLNVDELRRQQDDTDRVTAEKKSDRVRTADRELASVISSLAEGGGLGGSLGVRFAAEVGGAEGLDLARIEDTRTGKIAALDSQVGAEERKARDAVSIAGIDQTSAALQFAGTGLQIAARSKGLKEEENRAKDLV